MTRITDGSLRNRVHWWTILVVLMIVSSIPVPSLAYSYSVTNVEDYENSDMDLMPWGTDVTNVVKSWLNNAGWAMNFYHTNGNVDETDFGSQNSGFQGLDGAQLHYHFGHGVNNLGLGTAIQLSEWQLWNPDAVFREEVYKKWDNNNKWAIIDVCHLLEDEQWGGALKSSHGILSFASRKGASTDLPDRFFRNVIDYDYTMAYAWKCATQDTYESDCIGAVVFDTKDQLDYDHLLGQGYIAPDEYPDDDRVFVSTWQC